MWQAAQILFILSVLITLHEFGHYFTARWFKVRAEKFYLFMDAGFSLFKKKIGDTEWGIGWLPIGGYVKLSGMIDESMDTEQLKQPAKPYEFRSKPAWQRLIIMLGGIIVNILVAILIYVGMYVTIGQKYVDTQEIQKNGLAFGETGLKAGFQNGDKIISVDGKAQPRFNRLFIDVLLGDKVLVDRNGAETTVTMTDEIKKDILGKEGRDFIQARVPLEAVDSVMKNSNAEKAGLQKADKIIAINGQKFTYFDELTKQIGTHKNSTVQLIIERNKKLDTLTAQVDKDGKIGFLPLIQPNTSFEIKNKMSLFQAIPAAFEEAYSGFVYNIRQFKLILSPKTEAYKQVKSPIGMARMFPSYWNWENVLNMMAAISIALAFMNLLPIPGLDGGHALFTIFEMITGKVPGTKTMGYIQTGGMIFLLSLMVMVFGKDIYQLMKDFL